MTGRACRAAVLGAFAAIAAADARPGAQEPPGALEIGASPRHFIAYEDARPVLERLAAILPAELAGIPAADREAAWPGWVSRRDREIRARLAQGDEDSIANFLLFGTTFTRLPRALNDSTSIGGPQRAADIVRGRMADLIAAITRPGGNERLLFVREVMRRRGIALDEAVGREQARLFLLEIMTRTVGEVEGYIRSIESARSTGRGEFAVRSTLYRNRGLSSDTSIRPDFAIHRALEALMAGGMLTAGSVRRVAVIGPGLDFTDKAEGYDFYPQQTTQPFAAIDSLLRLRLAGANDVRLTTLDLSPRVNLHLEAARRRASAGIGYVVVLPRDGGERWQADLGAYWKALGGAIGDATTAPPPPEASGVDVRAVRIRPEVAGAIEVRDLNVVLERIAPLRDEERFDLVIATNVLLYYDVFEQSLALANIASMLRPGGFLLSNTVLVELAATPIQSVGHSTVTYSDRPDDNDDVVWYRRR
jgi:SAM-dependent methyltransferase